MAHPKRKTSKARRDKRRTHQVLHAPMLVTCPITGIKHPPHQAYEKDSKLYYRGKLFMELDQKKK